jgi:hypothetical protein
MTHPLSEAIDFLTCAFVYHSDQVVSRGQAKLAEALSDAEWGTKGSPRSDVPENVWEKIASR